MKPAGISPVTGLLSAKNRQTSTGNPEISKNEIRLRKNDAQTGFIEVPMGLMREGRREPALYSTHYFFVFFL
jgi:hypothetical protein